MNKFKKLYREFFGLTEAAVKQNPNDIEIAASVAKDPTALKAAQDAAKKAGGNIRITANEAEIDEAKLVNHITDYRGGVEFILRDPNDAGRVANEIRDWTERKGFVIINKKISKSGKVGYFYFRLGEDPGSESQKIQGYISQMPEIAKFRFKVRGEKPRVQQPTPELPPAPQRPMRKI
jgi:hypothetical protein